MTLSDAIRGTLDASQDELGPYEFRDQVREAILEMEGRVHNPRTRDWDAILKDEELNQERP